MLSPAFPERCKIMLPGARFAVRVLAVFFLIPSLLLCQVAQPAQSLDRHARKIQKTLASYVSGSTVFIELRDGSQSLGTLGTLSSTSFELIGHSGATQSLAYADVERVRKADFANGNRAVFRHHHGLIVGLILAGALVGFMAFAVVELRKS